MLKNSLGSQSISKVVLAGLLIGIVPASLPLHGQNFFQQKNRGVAQRRALKVKIGQRIKHIERIVTNLKRAKIIIPFILVAAGAALVVFAASVAVVALKVHLLKGLLKQPKKMAGKVAEKFHGVKLTSKTRPIFFKISSIEQLLGRTIEGSFLKKADASIPIFSVVTAVMTAIATPLVAVAAFKVLSKATVKKALEGVMQLEQIEKDFPGILTEQQRRTIARFKNLYKDSVTRGIIQGLRLKDALMTTVNEEVRKPSLLVAALGGPKKAGKIFSSYIKLKWKESLFEKALREGGNFIKSAIVKLQLKKTKKKLSKLEKRYTQLEASLKNAVQTYQMQANGILQELQKDLIKDAEKKELKPEMRLQPVVPL